MRRIFLLPAALIAISPASASLTQQQLDSAVARPPTGVSLPTRPVFRDQHGATLTLPQVAGGRPVVLLFADFTCRHVCGPGLTLTAGALHDSGAVAGRDYALAVVGFDPRDTPADASAMVGDRLASLPQEARAAELLSGDAAAITATTRALGYGYVYDAEHDQFAHDASVYVFAADGRLTTVLPELALRPATLRAALSGAGEVRASFADRIVHLCYGFAAAHGVYGRSAVLGLRGMALLLLAAGGLWLWRRRGHASDAA